MRCLEHSVSTYVYLATVLIVWKYELAALLHEHRREGKNLTILIEFVDTLASSPSHTPWTKSSSRPNEKDTLANNLPFWNNQEELPRPPWEPIRALISHQEGNPTGITFSSAPKPTHPPTQLSHATKLSGSGKLGRNCIFYNIIKWYWEERMTTQQNWAPSTTKHPHAKEFSLPQATKYFAFDTKL